MSSQLSTNISKFLTYDTLGLRMSIEYGSGEWMDFPYRCGWDNPNFLQIEFSSSKSQHDGRFSSFLQSWFYFGLLVETLESLVNVGDFLDSSGETITTRRLPEFIENWRSRMDQL